MVASDRKKLLVLDVNGVLLDTYRKGEQRPDRPHDGKVNKFFVYARPLCDDFIIFCLENFLVGVWSSAKKNNVQAFVDFIFKEAKQKLAFVWASITRDPALYWQDQEHCTSTGFRHPDNRYKPVFLKELWKLWRKSLPDLPWEAGDYGPTNTLLIDDSAYKAIKNPPHTAIFPKTYKATDLKDNYLGVELRTYLEGLLQARDVQVYLQQNPLGEPSNALGDGRWSKIFLTLKPNNEEDQLVAAYSELTEQSSMHNVPHCESTARHDGSRHHLKTLDANRNQEDIVQNLRKEDEDNLQTRIQKFRLEELIRN